MHKFIFEVFKEQEAVLIFNQELKNFDQLNISKFEDHLEGGEWEDDDENEIYLNPFFYLRSLDLFFDDVIALLREDESFKEQKISQDFINKHNSKYDHVVIITKDTKCFYQIQDSNDHIKGFSVVPEETFNGCLADSSTNVLIDGFDYHECMESVFSFKHGQTIKQLKDHLNSFGWIEKKLF